ncbi:hypothetical protein BDV95DRAFT_673780 [Massariosphaeria phaeospora]|uniref:WSC domain-containing protein n=1 Tax=Massariosphaeria phaeospora TaxID=100035 RepID=A0A7C8IG88_9PLEO|nr:hypothetical protein BDV95DRAFT_673780 [Massariosphaeria phaeospora]
MVPALVPSGLAILLVAYSVRQFLICNTLEPTIADKLVRHLYPLRKMSTSRLSFRLHHPFPSGTIQDVTRIDSVSLRTLDGNHYASGSMTNAQCIEFCAAKKFFYAGTEYSQECYCGRSIRNNATLVNDSDCFEPCSGNQTEPCGAPNRLSLYNTAPPMPYLNPGVHGYRSLGCYSDSVAARTLTVGMGTAGGAESLTVALCMSACAAGSYFYAGVEYSGECYCGNTLAGDGTPQDESGCKMACNGNMTESCGGSSRINIYTTRLAPPGWSSLGCYTDNIVNRTLTTQLFPVSNLTAELCVGACEAEGYYYAGTEYGGECYCGNSFAYGGGPAPDGNAGCNVACIGNSLEICGGPSRLNMYQHRESESTTSSTTVPTTGLTTAGVTTTVPGATTTITTDILQPTGIPNGWYYQGCWADNAYGRVMANEQGQDSNLTVESCIAICDMLGYVLAAMEYSVQCFCDDFLRNAATKASEADCSMSCGGNPNEKCGAGNRLSVYSNNNEPLTVYPLPSIQKTNLSGSWQYAGCLRDDAEERALPYQIILTTNNTANNCISQCSAFGYTSGGMEYGKECYCGDPGDVSSAGVTFVPDSECQIPCSGSVIDICGGANRLSYYTWQGPPLTEWAYASGNDAGAYQFLIGGVVVPLITQATRTGKITFLEKYIGTGEPNTTNAYELDLALINNFTGAWRPMHVRTDIFCSASITLPDKVGRQLNVGGWSFDSTYGVRLYWPDGSPGVWGENDWQENYNEIALQSGRWYPSVMIMANGSVLVVGGEEGSNGDPVPSLEILPAVGPTVYCDWLKRTDPNNLYPYLAVLPSGGIFVAYYNEAIILDETTFAITKQLPNMPGSVNNFLAGRTYPLEGTAVLLPQYAPYTDPLEILICGGSTPYQGAALDNCVTLAPEVPNAQWTLERMPSRRVLSCMTALPDGTFLIVNGAHQGVAGFGLAIDPNLNAVLYDPSKPLNTRFTVMANTTVARMYHSEAILLDDGRVLISGSDPEDDRFPQEHRVEVFVPPYLMTEDPIRPAVNTSWKDWSYGSTYTFEVSVPISKVSLLGAASSTHGNSMGQRTIFPAFSCTDNLCTVTAPPNAHVCPPGWFQMFVLSASGVPSMAIWVRVGGDPANLGSWPDTPSFTVPGEG